MSYWDMSGTFYRQSIPLLMRRMVKVVVRRYTLKRMPLKISQNSQENTRSQASACNFINKETPTQVFSCEFFKNFKNTFFYRSSLVAASRKIISVLGTIWWLLILYMQSFIELNNIIENLSRGQTFCGISIIMHTSILNKLSQC